MNLRTTSVGIALTVVLATAGLGSVGAQERSPEQTPAALAAQRGVLAESILAAKERALGEPLAASIRASLKGRMEALSVEQLEALAQQGESANLPLALGSVTSDLVYTPVTPCRVFDSRVSQGGPGPIPANTQRNVLVAGTVGFPAQGGFAGGCGVPVGATSAIINFVTVLPAGPGNIRAWAVADPQPPAPLAAIMNYGSVVGLPAIANGVAVPLCNPAATSCTLGDLRLQADTNGTDILGDVVGYFGPAAGLVSSVNSITGPVTIAAGSNISVTPSGSTLTIANTAPVNPGTVTSVGSGSGLTGGPITGTGTLSIAAGGVATSMIANAAVGAAQIATDAVGASELANNAVDTAAILDAQVTAPKIAPGAIGAAQIDSTQVQLRVSGTCADGEYFRGINADGTLDCNLLPVAADRVLDLTGDVGTHVAVALRADQRPLVAYHDQTNGNLKVYDCADASCASGTRRLLDSAGDVGENAAIAVGPGDLAVIAYRDVGLDTLKLYACANAACSSGVARTLDAGVNVSGAISMALRADGRPLVAYQDLTNFRLRVYDCDNPGSSSGTARFPAGSGMPYATSVALRTDGRALIALGGNAGAAIPVRVYECSDAACTTGTQRTLTDLSYSPSVSLVIRSNNRPLVAVAGGAGPLQVVDCTDAVCLASSSASFGTATTSALGIDLRADGRALLVYGLPAAGGLNVLDCNSAACSAGSSRSLVGPGTYGTYAALALRADRRPVVAFYDGDNDDLRLHICANPDCI